VEWNVRELQIWKCSWKFTDIETTDQTNPWKEKHFKSPDNIFNSTSGQARDSSKYKGVFRDHICHKQYKQRLCKIIITRVKVHFVDVF